MIEAIDRKGGKNLEKIQLQNDLTKIYMM